MTAHLFAEAVDTLLTVCRALSVWIVLLSVVATCAAYTVVTAVAWMGRGVWRCGVAVAGLRKPRTGPLAAERPASDSGPPNAAEKRSEPHTPAWARQPHYDDRSAA